MTSSRKISTPDILVKVILVGDSGVGKTNLLTYFCEGTFRDSYVATIGVDFKIKMVQVDDKKIKLQIWDTAGQERFRNITQTYYKGAAGIILAYSITDAKSFANINTWLKQIQANSSETVCKMLVATKADLQSERQVSFEEGKNLAKKHSMLFFQVSSKICKNVSESFLELTREIKVKRAEIQGLQTQQSLRIINIDSRGDNKKCAC